MTQYGYRIFVIEGVEGNRRTPMNFDAFAPWDAHSSNNAMDHLQVSLDHVTKQRYADIPAQIPTVPRKDAKPIHLQFEQLDRRGTRIDGRFHFGSEGDFPALSEQDARTGTWKNTPMGQRAPVRPYRVHFHIPPAGHAGFMVAETIGRICAGVHLLKILNAISHNDLCHQLGATNRQTAEWIRWRATPVVDDQRLSSFIQEMQGAKLRLSRESRAGHSGQSTGAVTIEQDISDLPDDLLRALLRAWEKASGKSSQKEKLRRLGARTAGVFFGDLVDSGEFDAAELTAVENGRTQRVAPESLDRLFEYPVGDLPPSDAQLLSDSARTIKRMVGPINSFKIQRSQLNLP